MTNKYTGQCLCGSFRYSISIIDLEGAFSCNCIDCRRATGSIFAALVLCKIDNFNGVVSVLKKLTHKGGSGNDMHRYCCQDCYCPIYINVTRSGVMHLYTGTLDNISVITLSENIYFENDLRGILGIGPSFGTWSKESENLKSDKGYGKNVEDRVKKLSFQPISSTSFFAVGY